MSDRDQNDVRNQALYIDDSLAVARRINQLPTSSSLPQNIRNLQTVLFSPQAEITSRRTAYANLQRSAEPEAKEVLDRFAKSGLTLDEKLNVPECGYNSR